MMCFDELEEVNGIDACLELQNDQAENIKNTYENSAKYYVNKYKLENNLSSNQF